MINKFRVAERSRDIGNFLVGRLLPFAKKRQVGPFTFIDHMGPAEIGPGKYMDVDQHPHIGLSTLTYLLEGEIEHRDSTGAVQIIKPGDVGFMTAGRGVTHTERTPAHQRDGMTYTAHGYQIWVAMPTDKEEMDPSFQFLPASSLPKKSINGLKITVVAGDGFGLSSPLAVHSPLFMVDVKSARPNQLAIAGELEGEIAIVVVSGIVQADDEQISAGEMLISKTIDTCTIELAENTQVLLFGGTPFMEERFLYWNFVSHSKQRLERAKEDWRNKHFPKVPGDETYVPLPERR
jgi:redox-sensitive bicupin YhaK (pirin superfamily)